MQSKGLFDYYIINYLPSNMNQNILLHMASHIDSKP